MTNLITIIIPVYNHEPELKQALASIAAQTYEKIEVIIVDDGSDKEIRNWKLETIAYPKNNNPSPYRGGEGGVFTDAEIETPSSLPLPGGGYSVRSIDSRRISLQIIRQENRGAPAARNRGLQEARGEYVIFWDADVIAEPDMLQKMVQSLQAHPEASYVYCDFKFGWKKMKARQFDPEALKKNNYIHSTSLIRRSALLDKPWDESLKRFQDWDLWLTLLEQKKIGIYVPEYLFLVIPNRGGISHWLPSFAYRAPWRWAPWVRGRVCEYEAARKILLDKHFLTMSDMSKE